MLSFRLKTLRDYYRGESSVWDIGCDHGLLGLSFGDHPSIQEIHLVDPSEPVIVALKQYVDAYITIPDSILSIHHQSGQSVQLSSKSNLVFIAGMGGSEIQEIITHLLPQLTADDRLVISPHRKILELRKFLQESSLHLEEEISLYEGGQFYQILSLSLKAGSKVSPYGEAVWRGEVGEKYKNQQIAAYGAHQDKASLKYLEYLKSL